MFNCNGLMSRRGYHLTLFLVVVVFKHNDQKLTNKNVLQIVRMPELRSSVGVRGLSGDGLPSKDNSTVPK